MEALGPNGRSVKCSKCAHRWHATADGDSAVAPVGASDMAAPEMPPAAEPAPGAEAAVEAPQPEESPVAADAAPDAESAEPLAPPTDMREALGLAATPGDISDEASPSRSRRRQPAPALKRRSGVARVLSIFVLLLAVFGAAGAAVFMKNEIMMWLPATQRLYAMVGMSPEVLGHGLQIVEPTPKKEIDGNDEILVVEGDIRNIAEKPVEVPLMRGALLDANGKELQSWTFTAAKARIAPGEQARYRTEFRNPPPEAQSLDITFTRGGAAPESAKHDVKAEQKHEGGKEDGMMSESTAQHH
jgi:Protein of unknown function (DUF3426)